jgi:uncharacterized protein (DUF362 family)/Pyruvate/2-oxoacid:ferredoxin oxidoreductase delta subunit
MKWYDFFEGRVGVGHAWTAAEVRAVVEAVFEQLGSRLPASDAAVVIKPNLNNDLPALVGNCTDLRVLQALLEVLRDRGHTDITVADGSNVGMERRNIDTFGRLRVDRLARRFGARTLDLNRTEGRDVALETGTTSVAREILDAPFLVALPKLKTHAEAGLSMATKLWMGAVVAQRKRDVHADLLRNLPTLASAIHPHLILLDALVGMEGNGPGDGLPFRMETLVASTHPWLLDLTTARLAGFPWRSLGYLVHARDAGRFPADLPDRVEQHIPVRRPIQPPPPRSLLAPLSEHRFLRPLKLAIRPVVDHPVVSRTAYSLGVIQDRYVRDDDGVTGVVRQHDPCTECGRCGEVCPDAIAWQDIGTAERGQGCLGCLYCHWICPTRAIELQGDTGYMQAHLDRYKSLVEGL